MSKISSKSKKISSSITKKKIKLKLSSSKNTKPTTRKIILKKPITDKEKEFREANLIANLENNKKNKITKRFKKTTSPKQTSSLLFSIVEGMQERKAKNITILNLNKIETRVADYFIICDADSSTHVSSIADSVEETVIKLTNEKAFHAEGRQNNEWILIDYINIVAHVFLKETREFYNLEEFWGDAEITKINA